MGFLLSGRMAGESGRVRWRLLIAVVMMFGVIGIPSATDAAPDDSQRLRGLVGRTFEVHIVGWSYRPGQGTQKFDFEGDTCLVFEDDGTFLDVSFPPGQEPVPGTWSQQSVGAATPVSAKIVWDIGGGIVLTAETVGGEVRPGPGGVLLLDTDVVHTLTVGGNTLPNLDPWGEFHVTGFENPDCSV